MNSKATLASAGAAERTKAAALHSHSTAAFSGNSVGADKSISIISFLVDFELIKLC